MAVAVLAAERALAELEDRPAGQPRGRQPRPRWRRRRSPPTGPARSAAGGNDVSVEQFRRFAAPNIVRFAVPAVAKACVSDPDDRLYDLLVGCDRRLRRAVRASVARRPPPTRSALVEQ